MRKKNPPWSENLEQVREKNPKPLIWKKLGKKKLILEKWKNWKHGKTGKMFLKNLQKQKRMEKSENKPNPPKENGKF